ncbi:hypothetical protein DSECCO2_654020 [anaerobic digester metagenome]
MFHALNKMLVLSTETTAVGYSEKNSGMPGFLAGFVNNVISIPFIVIFILTLIEFILLFKHWIVKKNKPWLRSVFWAFLTIQILTIIFGAQAEYQRLFTPCLPLVIIMMFFYIDWIIASINKVRYRKHKVA